MAGCSEETLVARLRSLCLVWVNEGQNKSRCSRVPGDFAEAQAGRRQIPSLFSVQCLWSLSGGYFQDSICAVMKGLYKHFFIFKAAEHFQPTFVSQIS